MDCHVFDSSAFGGIGFADDYLKVVHRRNLGLTARGKLVYQGLAGVCIAVALLFLQAQGSYSTRLIVPFAKRFRPDLVIQCLQHYALVAAGVCAVRCSSSCW